MPVARLTSKGQLVIPKEIREHMQLQPGDQLDFMVRDDGEVVIRPVVADVTALRGMLKTPGRKPVSLGSMKKAIRERAARHVR